MHSLKIALDWTVNTNHIGFVVAKELGFYQELGIALDLVTPDQDDYQVTPAKKLELGQVDFALCPMESVLSYRTKAKPFAVKAIAALFKSDISAIVTLKRADVQSPKDLDGKIYASYQARYEDHIVKEMIKNDGGKGNIKITYPAKLGIWNTLLEGTADATWIFDNWEGVEATRNGVALSTFKMEDFGIPYSYSPVIMASEDKMNKLQAIYRAFLQASKKGFLHAAANPLQAVKIMEAYMPSGSHDLGFLLDSQLYTSQYYGDEANWGQMDMAKVQEYLDWIYAKGLEVSELSAKDLVTNALL